MNPSSTSEEQKIWEILEEVKDPEVPVLSILDLGILREVEVEEGEEGKPKVSLVITPTYSGCPAMDVISMDIRLKLIEKGYRQVQIRQSLSPAWTTDWMSEDGKRKLLEYGIAPPKFRSAASGSKLFAEESVACPLCHSNNTEQMSEFGSTACKSLYRCLDCREAFDYFKCH